MNQQNIIKLIEDRIGELSTDNSIKIYIETGYASSNYDKIMTKIYELERLKGKIKSSKPSLNSSFIQDCNNVTCCYNLNGICTKKIKRCRIWINNPK